MTTIICEAKLVGYEGNWIDLNGFKPLDSLPADHIELKDIKEVNAYLNFRALPGKSLRFILKHPSLFNQVSKYLKEHYGVNLKEDTVYLILTPEHCHQLNPVHFEAFYKFEAPIATETYEITSFLKEHSQDKEPWVRGIFWNNGTVSRLVKHKGVWDLQSTQLPTSQLKVIKSLNKGAVFCFENGKCFRNEVIDLITSLKDDKIRVAKRVYPGFEEIDETDILFEGFSFEPSGL